MKIGILTFHAPCNFGANLQAYSSTCYFRKHGHEVVVLNFIREADHNYRNKISAPQWQEHHDFITRNLPLTKILSTVEEVENEIISQKLDLMVIGADAVWRMPQNKEDLVFYGTWLRNLSTHVPTASLSAAHMGNGFRELDDEYKRIIRECLLNFKLISTRDSWTRDRLNKDIFGSDIVKIVNPDPVVWLSEFLGNREIDLPQEIEKNKYFLMSLPKDWIKYHTQKRLNWFKDFKQIVNNNGFQLVELPIPEGDSGAPFDYTIPFPLNPADWFSWIRDAKAFCGVRFHAIVSCISSGTPFYSIDTYGNPSRLLTVINRMGLYRFARLFDGRSKIRNLLKGSSFENNRVHGEIINLPPDKLFSILTTTDSNRILEFRDSLRAQFDSTAAKIME